MSEKEKEEEKLRSGFNLISGPSANRSATTGATVGPQSGARPIDRRRPNWITPNSQPAPWLNGGPFRAARCLRPAADAAAGRARKLFQSPFVAPEGDLEELGGRHPAGHLSRARGREEIRLVRADLSFSPISISRASCPRSPLIEMASGALSRPARQHLEARVGGPQVAPPVPLEGSRKEKRGRKELRTSTYSRSWPAGPPGRSATAHSCRSGSARRWIWCPPAP